MLDLIAPNPTRDEQVYARLRQAIIEGTLEPGQDLVVTTVAAQLGVSRIPVMHACQRLIGEGFLIANPRRSVTVAPMTQERIVEGTEVLLALESLALERIAERATDADVRRWTDLNVDVRAFRREPGSFVVNLADYQFHAALWQAARMPYLYQQISLVYDHNEPSRALSRLSHSPGRSADEHAAIVTALANHDAIGAKEAIRAHRLNGAERSLAVLRERKGASEARPTGE
jgi:DNA-binding GntR family transcriptional regulator